MSVISEKVRRALYAKMNVAPVTDIATGIYYMKGDDEAVRPIVVFYRVPKEKSYALGNNLAYEKDVWVIKVLSDEDSSATESAAGLGERLLNVIETTIGQNLIIEGNTVLMCRRAADMPSYTETVSDRSVYHTGAMFNVTAG